MIGKRCRSCPPPATTASIFERLGSGPAYCLVATLLLLFRRHRSGLSGPVDQAADSHLWPHCSGRLHGAGRLHDWPCRGQPGGGALDRQQGGPSFSPALAGKLWRPGGPDRRLGDSDAAITHAGGAFLRGSLVERSERSFSSLALLCWSLSGSGAADHRHGRNRSYPDPATGLSAWRRGPHPVAPVRTEHPGSSKWRRAGRFRVTPPVRFDQGVAAGRHGKSGRRSGRHLCVQATVWGR